MARPRSAGNKELPKYLYRDKAGFYLLHPTSRTKVRLGAQEAAARLIHADAVGAWENDRIERRAAQLARRLHHVALPPEKRLTVAAYSALFRETVLPTLTKRNGKPIGDGTRADYGRMLRNQIETLPEFRETALADVDPVVVRTALRGWVNDSKHFYNYLMAILSRVFAQAVDEGRLRSNPMKEVARRAVAKREVLIPDDAYAAIVAELADWQATACDLLYLTAAQPCDGLALGDADFDQWPASRMVPGPGGAEVLCFGTLSITRRKTGEAVDIDVNEPLLKVIQWFRDWKRAQGFLPSVPGWVLYPKDAPKRWRGRPVSVEHLSRAFSAAVKAAGFKPGQYTLRDLRPMALTADHRAGGDGSKGAHKTEQMKRHYVRDRLPQKAVNVLELPQR